eukprot:UC4_evm3s808
MREHFRGKFRLEEDVVFSEQTGLKCDIYHPLSSSPGFSSLPEGRRAAVVLIYGGAWISGSKGAPYLYAASLATNGYLAVCPQYR